ncbi:MAG: alpha-E domain-containing protein [Sulfuricurvum sp.]|uniref:alpha-E domain-containing protein n=1 Tax=Sulfuricurvum sp. TaxID=2025608 RepID=UPI0026076466|nr:alpha-E domain-containing protein [Sulfuricurvum sp.]MDD2370226.1 alpha-E domain-containing protein [Sulfuricurvum sp.]MDD2949477.1 alpha-E domain-containing protein [Sulfuricurvum sp.]MDD5118739.1 alpha-E domain-containing protein [Sulfuricurvum sp.]
MGGRVMINGAAISVNTAQHLYWFGRYVQRVQTMLVEMLECYDHVIDRDFEYGNKFFEKLGIQAEYKNGLDFLNVGVYGAHQGSIESIIKMARENAIETRHLLDERGFATLNKIYNHLSEGRNRAAISPTHLEEIVDNCSLILGIFSSELDRTRAYQLIRFGQQIERFDLILRLYGEIEMVTADIDVVNNIARQLNRHYRPINVTTSDIPKFLVFLNGVVDRVIHNKGCVPGSSQSQSS